MGYVAFASELQTDAPRQARTRAPSFTPLEEEVIALARRSDATRELSSETRVGRIVEWLLGIRLGRPLANQRLEALRRFASLTLHHPERVSEPEIERFTAAGFSRQQALQLRSAAFDSPRQRVGGKLVGLA